MPIVVLSSSLISLIEAMLEQFIEHKLYGIEVVANLVAVRDGFKSINEDGSA
jgi:hypothetical protein